MSHRFPIRVYYEDTDLAGIVYYANYLRYMERARTEWIRERGGDQTRLKEEGIVFAVRRVEADYLRASFFDDELVVHTAQVEASHARAVLSQDIYRGEEKVFASLVTMVAIDVNTGRPRPMPAIVRP